MMDVDFELLLKQDDDFRKFVTETVYQFTKVQPNWNELITILYNFYNEDLTPEQTARILRVRT